ncbi:MAG: hypothetical protein C7B45_13915 [Sulfobacillus acidophilus]|uniref:Uncharacterized protein n=1 Tax=Sulfobacillus acidophilus TaxID=53633 RepID=A0A2T2WEL0_9FIRM|nr:MAG: hypothetical protein C7B45_13915 [Sulfobacillus acidophilus]
MHGIMRLAKLGSAWLVEFDPSGIIRKKTASRQQKRACSGKFEVTHQSISKERARRLDGDPGVIADITEAPTLLAQLQDKHSLAL